MSILFNLTGTTSQLQSEIFPPLNLVDGNYQIGLIYFIGNNSVYNIHEKNNTFQIIMEHADPLEDDLIIRSDIQCSLKPGMYDFELLRKAMQDEFEQAPDKYLKDHKGTKSEVIDSFKKIVKSMVLTSSRTRHTLVFKIQAEQFEQIFLSLNVSNSIGPVLGIPFHTVTTTRISDTDKDFREEHLKPINLNSLRVLNIHCNLTANSYINGVPSHIIYSIPLSQAPGYQIIEAPKDVVFLPVVDNIIDIVEIRITNQNNELVDFRGDEIVVVLELRKT